MSTKKIESVKKSQSMNESALNNFAKDVALCTTIDEVDDIIENLENDCAQEVSLVEEDCDDAVEKLRCDCATTVNNIRKEYVAFIDKCKEQKIRLSLKAKRDFIESKLVLNDSTFYETDESAINGTQRAGGLNNDNALMISAYNSTNASRRFIEIWTHNINDILLSKKTFDSLSDKHESQLKQYYDKLSTKNASKHTSKYIFCLDDIETIIFVNLLCKLLNDDNESERKKSEK